MGFLVVKKGYDTREVDDYVAKSEAALNKYRNMEAAISNSLISAEATKSEIIQDAEAQAKRIVEQANSEVNEQLGAIRKMLDCEKKALADFCAEYDTVVRNYFTSNASEVTAPLKEKLLMIENILNEPRENAEASGDSGADDLGNIESYF